MTVHVDHETAAEANAEAEATEKAGIRNTTDGSPMGQHYTLLGADVALEEMQLASKHVYMMCGGGWEGIGRARNAPAVHRAFDPAYAKRDTCCNISYMQHVQ